MFLLNSKNVHKYVKLYGNQYKIYINKSLISPKMFSTLTICNKSVLKPSIVVLMFGVTSRFYLRLLSF